MEKKNMLGFRLRAAREKAKLTQTQLAVKVGLRQGRISDLESGKVRSAEEIRVSTLDKLCKALDVTPNMLMGYDAA